MDATLIATLGAEPQVVALCADHLSARGARLTDVVVLHTTPPIVALDGLRRHFAAQPDGPRFAPIPLPIADVLTAGDIEQFGAALYAELRRRVAAGQRVHLLLAGGRKPMAMVGMSVAQLLLGRDDHVWYLASNEGLRLSGRYTPGPGDTVELVEIPLARFSPAPPRFLRSFAADSPNEALRVAGEQAAQQLEHFVQHELTRAEREVAALVVQELATVGEIAARLHKSPKTVTNQLNAVYSKLESTFGLQPDIGLKREFLRRELAPYFAAGTRKVGS